MYFSKTAPKKTQRKTPKISNPTKGSFRDPSGSLFIENGQLLRRVNLAYKENYDHLIKSGLYAQLVGRKYLVSHKELKPSKAEVGTYKILKPEIVPFVSYPYEWCFSQLKDAALLTLAINSESLEKGMLLKDASGYNIQFLEGHPIFIDTLSFEKYEEGSPWIAYQQFCRHFLSPLLLASYKDYRLMQFSKIFIDGIPLDLTSKLLPSRTFVNFSVFSNIHLHSKAENILQDKFVRRKPANISKNSLLAILDNLENLISGLELKTKKTEWQDYYQRNSYGSKSLADKRNVIRSLLGEAGKINTLWDLGSNTGYFSKTLVPNKTLVINFDNDFLAIEKNYEDVKKRRLTNVLPLLLDLTNPSPGIGWVNEERDSLVQRGPCDAALALALIHHLAISNNLPFSKIADFFARICRFLIIEFVPKEDFQVKRLLLNRDDIFTDYSQEDFEKEFSRYFSISKKVNIKNSGRVIYLMKKK